MRHRTALGVTLSRLIGLMIFIVLLIIANALSINNHAYTQVIDFLNYNLGLIIIFSILLYLGELFLVFRFPLNIPAPILNAFGGAFLVKFIFRIIYLSGTLAGTDALYVFRNFEAIIYVVVFFIVIIVGYVNIFLNVGKEGKEERERMTREERRIERRKRHERKLHEKDKDLPRHLEWKDVSEELKKAAYRVASNIKESLEPEEKQKRKKKKVDKAAKRVRKNSASKRKKKR